MVTISGLPTLQIPSGYVKIAMENGPFMLIYLLKIVIFNSYVSLPEGAFGGNWIHKDVKMFN